MARKAPKSAAKASSNQNTAERSSMPDYALDSKAATNRPSKPGPPRSNGWTYEKLAPYREFDKLYGERKYASKYPSNPFEFLKLPPEIRNQIYRELLYFDYVELAAKRSDGVGNGLACIHHMRRYKREIVPKLKLLRANKQVNSEASAIFYGENEFRFTANYGFDILFFFCRTIGKANTARLQKITEHVPLEGSYEYVRGDRRARVSDNAWSNFQGLMDRMGLHGQGRGAWNFNIPKTIARTGAGLKQYTLVLPESYHLWRGDLGHDGYGLLRWMTKEKLGEVKKELVFLSNPLAVGQIQDTNHDAEHHQSLIKSAESKGWKVSRTTYDKLGRYEIKKKVDSEIPDADDSDDEE